MYICENIFNYGHDQFIDKVTNYYNQEYVSGLYFNSFNYLSFIFFYL